MASTARVVCWQNREEWLHVYRTLFNFDDPEAQRRAVNRVDAWKSRSMGKLPLAIESTANLISAHLGLVDGGTRDVQVRLTLAMAIVRFVNGMVDQVQKGKFARSVQSIGEEIGLPDWLVDLRHEATHASLPSIETLHCGLRASLAWLQEEYWEAQINIHEESTEKLQQLLSKYRDVALSHVLKRKKMSKFKSNSALTELSNEIASLISMSNLWSLVPSLLCDRDMLVPSCEQLNTLCIKWPKENSSFDSSISDVPVEIINMWKPLIESLDKESSEFIGSIVLYFLESHSQVPDDQTKDISHCYAGWVKLLLQSKGKPSLVLAGDLPWANLLKIALANPTPYSLTIIPLILDNIPLIDATMKEKIQRLITIFVGQFSPNCVSSNDLDNSQDVDLEGWMASRGSKPCLEKSLQPNQPREEWAVSHGSTQWYLIPFGEVLGTADVSPNNLQLPSVNPITRLQHTA
ncbi:uncharacterized protein LOC144665624 [Oculina patagonica]